MTNETIKTFTQGVKVPYIDVFNKPQDGAGLETQFLFGETIEIFPIGPNWAKVVTSSDYDWYLKPVGLGVPTRNTHRVRVPQVIVKSGPSMKTPTVATLSMNARLSIWEYKETPDGTMGRAEDLGWVFMDKLAKAGEFEEDFVGVMQSFVGAHDVVTPYEWGGRHLTKDCSSLLGTGYGATGGMCDRDVLPLSRSFGNPFDPETDGKLRRGVVVFWTKDKGRHVGAMIDDVTLVHATIAPGIRGVVEQPLEQVIHDQEKGLNGRPTIYRYLPGYPGF